MNSVWEDPRISRGMTAQMGHRRTRVTAGDKPLGWKVAFGSTAAMQRLDTTGALIGFLMQGGLLPNNATVSISNWTHPAAEPEIAIYVGKDLPAGADRAAAKAAIAAVGPAIELVDTEYAPDANTVEKLMSANIFHRNVILGSQDLTRAGCVLDNLMAHILKNGSEIEKAGPPSTSAEALIDIVRHVANMAAAFGEQLRTGEVIITGSLVTPIAVSQGDDVIFHLDPIGTVSARFAA